MVANTLSKQTPLQQLSRCGGFGGWVAVTRRRVTYLFYRSKGSVEEIKPGRLPSISVDLQIGVVRFRPMLTIPTLKKTLLIGFVVCVLAAACSSNDGRGEQFVPPDTTVAETTTTSDAPSTSVDDTSTTPTDAPSTSVDETTTTVVERLTYDEIAEFIEETNPTIIVGEDVVNEDGSIGSSVPFNPLPPELLPEPVVVTVPPTTASTTTEAPSTTEPTTTPSTTEPATDTPTTTTVWREATDRIPAEATTTYLQEDPLLREESWITYGASEPIRLEPGMRLTTDITWVDGAWIIGILETNNSADEIAMFVCIENFFYKGSQQNVVAGWALARTDTVGVYQVIYKRNLADGRKLAAVRPNTPADWDAKLANNQSILHNIDVSECW